MDLKFNLNPMQQEVMKKGLLTTNDNFLISAPTASGKTLIAVLAIDKTLNEGKKAIYVAPMKTLVDEKVIEFGEMFPGRKITPMSSDYTDISEERKKHISESDILIMTNEMLQSRSTKHRSENNSWLQQVGCLVVDECHLIASKGRGATTEAAIITFTTINSEARLVFLSATINRIGLIAKWMTVLNGKNTVFVEHDYRPTKLNIDFVPVNHEGRTAREKAFEKIDKSMEIIKRYHGDKFIVFTPSKEESITTASELQRIGYKSQYHNADLGHVERRKVEEGFKGTEIDIVCSTPTLAMGCNLPARRVIIQGVVRGIEVIEGIDLLQMCGRAGRPKYDKEGNAYIIHPIELDPNSLLIVNVKSLMESHKDLLFHMLSQIYLDTIKSVSDAETWWKRTFAHLLKNDVPKDTIDYVMQDLVRYKMIEILPDGSITITHRGRVSVVFYFNPIDIYNWIRNFHDLFAIPGAEKNNFWLAKSFVQRTKMEDENYVSKGEMEDVMKFSNELYNNGIGVSDIEAKHIMRYYYALTTDSSAGNIYAIKRDIPRMVAAMKQLGQTSGDHDPNFFDNMGIRFKYGVPERAIYLMSLDGIGVKKSKMLMEIGIENKEDLMKNKSVVIDLLGLTLGKRVFEQVEFNPSDSIVLGRKGTF